MKFLFLLMLVLASTLATRAATWTNITATTKANICGDLVVETPAEDCEGTNLNNQSCSTLGYAGGTLSCDISCSFDTFLCLSPTPSPSPTTSSSSSSSSDPTPTPTPTPTHTSTPTPTVTPTPTPSVTPTPTPTASSTPSTTPSPILGASTPPQLPKTGGSFLAFGLVGGLAILGIKLMRKFKLA